MSADINHGDSGGPVVNSEGRVVASVAVTDISSHALAVPVDVVWKFLTKAGLNSVDAASRAINWNSPGELHYAEVEKRNRTAPGVPGRTTGFYRA
jgi:S1-C subfamily serine protease